MSGTKPERAKKAGRAKRELSGTPEHRLRDEGFELKDDEAGITIENPSQLDRDAGDKYPESHGHRGVEKKDPDGSARPL